MTRATHDMLESWEAFQQNEQAFNLSHEMMRLTFRIAGETLFSIDLTDDADDAGQAVAVGLGETSARLSRPLSLPLFVPTPTNRRFKASMQTLDRVVYGMIAERRRTGEDRGDLLSMFMMAEDEETGERMNDQQLRDEVLTMLAAGHETTANALTWTWFLLAQYPEVEANLEAELAAVLGGRVPGMDDVPKLEYTRMVIQEGIRLYPPAFVFQRHAIEADEIGGYPIPAGQAVSISPYVMHRHPEFWEDPDTFNPERFSPKQVAQRHRFAYIPFAAGPRQCIGSMFAMIEAQLVLATVAQHYRVRLVPEYPVVPHSAITLRPQDGVQVTLEPRSGAPRASGEEFSVGL